MDELAKVRFVMHYMMSAAFIEIRASETLNAARKFADVFHNLPLAVLRCETVQDYEDVFTEMLARGQRNGLEKYLRELRTVAEKSLAETRGPPLS